MSFLKEITKGVDLQQASFKKVVVNDVNSLSGNSKKRIAFKQTKAMEVLQKNLRTWIRKRLRFQKNIVLHSAVGAVPGSSYLTPAVRHRRRDGDGHYYFPRYFWSIDLKSAFQSTQVEKLISIILKLDENNKDEEHELLNFFNQYCFSSEGGLIIGAGASPDLFNVYCEVLIDKYVRDCCKASHTSYTRYIDDLVFFSNNIIEEDFKLAVRKIVTNAGFIVNEKKTISHDLRNKPVHINGVGVDIHGNIFTPRKFTSSLKGLLHKALIKKDSIPKNVINGKVQVFLQTLAVNGRMPNKTEQKVLRLCHQFLRQQEEVRRIAKEIKKTKRPKLISSFWINFHYDKRSGEPF